MNRKKEANSMHKKEDLLVLSAVRLHALDQALKEAEEDLRQLTAANTPQDSPEYQSLSRQIQRLRDKRDDMDRRHLTLWMEILANRKTHES